MSKIPVFAGLGSDALFDDATKEQAIRDSRRPLGKTLLHACYTIFVEEVSRATCDSEVLVRIDLDDFSHPQSLLEPHPRYRTNPIVQHATLLVVQSLRFLALEQSNMQSDIPKTEAVSGFCVGLLTAVAVASSCGNTQLFLQHAGQCFRVALMIGIASQRMRRLAHSLPSSLPWSLIVGGVSRDEMADLISSKVYVIVISIVVHDTDEF